MKTLLSLFAIPVIALGSVMLISAIGGESAKKKVQELHGVKDAGQTDGQ